MKLQLQQVLVLHQNEFIISRTSANGCALNNTNQSTLVKRILDACINKIYLENRFLALAVSPSQFGKLFCISTSVLKPVPVMMRFRYFVVPRFRQMTVSSNELLSRIGHYQVQSIRRRLVVTILFGHFLWMP